MIYSPGRGYLFIHIPKTGGTSLTLALEDKAKADDVLIGDTPKAQKRKRRQKNIPALAKLKKHSKLSDLDEVLSKEDLEALFVFTLVRNPWDRLVSYYHWLRAQTYAHTAVQRAKTTDFLGFVKDPMTRAVFQATPYGSFLLDADGRERCDLFIRLEHVEEDLPKLEQALDFRLTFPHANASQRPEDFRGVYDEEARNIVAEACAEDIDRFGYSFE